MQTIPSTAVPQVRALAHRLGLPPPEALLAGTLALDPEASQEFAVRWGHAAPAPAAATTPPSAEDAVPAVAVAVSLPQPQAMADSEEVTLPAASGRTASAAAATALQPLNAGAAESPSLSDDSTGSAAHITMHSPESLGGPRPDNGDVEPCWRRPTLLPLPQLHQVCLRQ